MKKEHIRDYATEAFRFYAAEGRPTYEELKQRLYSEALKRNKREIISVKGISNPTEQAIINAQKEVDSRTPELLDILAVENTLHILSYHKDSMGIKKAIEIVYFTNPTAELERNVITDRVHRAEIMIPTTERQVYRWLKIARQSFALERGLRM